jgi:hypothetical protein
MTYDDESRALWVGRELSDLDGLAIGIVVDVRKGDDMDDPTWLVVDAGLADGKRLLLPAGQVRRSVVRLTVLHSKDRVTSSPPVADATSLTDGDKGSLCRYYGLQYVASEGADGCSDMTDVRPAG